MKIEEFVPQIHMDASAGRACPVNLKLPFVQGRTSGI